MKYHSQDKKAIFLNAIYSFIWLIIFIIFLLFLLFFIKNEIILKIVKVLFSVFFLYLVLDIFVFSKIKYDNYKFLITKNYIEIKKGLFCLKRTIFLTKHIQKVEVVEEIFSLSKIVIFFQSFKVELPYIKTSKAQKLKKEIKKYINEEDVDVRIKTKAIKQGKNSFIIYFMNKVPLIFIISILCLWLKKYLLIIDIVLVLISYLQYKNRKIWIENDFIIIKKNYLKEKAVFLFNKDIIYVQFKETVISRLYNLRKIVVKNEFNKNFLLGYYSKKTENKIISNLKKETI